MVENERVAVPDKDARPDEEQHHSMAWKKGDAWLPRVALLQNAESEHWLSICNLK